MWYNIYIVTTLSSKHRNTTSTLPIREQIMSRHMGLSERERFILHSASLINLKEAGVLKIDLNEAIMLVLKNRCRGLYGDMTKLEKIKEDIDYEIMTSSTFYEEFFD